MIKSMNRTFRTFGVACVLAVASMAMAPAAHAELYDAWSGIDSGNAEELTSSDSWDVHSGGTLTVQVSDLGHPMTMMERLSSLSFMISFDTTTVLGAFGSEGTLSVFVPDPGRITLSIFATPTALLDGRLHMGGYSWNANFEATPPVPLPASFWLLAAGAAWAIVLQRKRVKLFRMESGGSPGSFATPALAH
ncbi:MAG: hypothetical protein WDO56_23850 [Gammaproteobacteria bacterium]